MQFSPSSAVVKDEFLNSLEALDSEELDILLGNNGNPDVDVNGTPSKMLQDDLYSARDMEFDSQPGLEATNSTDSEKNLLLISIPQQYNQAPVFDSIQSINVAPDVVSRINEASAGFDGAAIPFSMSDLEETPVVQEVVRRPPLQVIHVVNQIFNISLNEKPSKAAVKRKQQFNLSREDGIVFLSESPESEVKKQKLNENHQVDEVYDWAPTDDEDTDVAPEAIDQTNVCQYCKKVFKKLVHHKCKKLPSKSSAPTKKTFNCNVCKRRFTDEPLYISHMATHKMLSCDRCCKAYKTITSLATHVKKCYKNNAPVAKIKSVKPQIAMEVDDVENSQKTRKVIVSKPAKIITRSKKKVL